MRIRWTLTASADLQNIYDYLKEHEPHLAQPTVIEVRKSARSLKKFPLRGRQGREQGTRELLQRRLPHIIAYRVKDDAWCPRFRVAEGELTWDCRVIQDLGWSKEFPAQVSAQNQRIENRGSNMIGARTWGTRQPTSEPSPARYA